MWSNDRPSWTSPALSVVFSVRGSWFVCRPQRQYETLDQSRSQRQFIRFIWLTTRFPWATKVSNALKLMWRNVAMVSFSERAERIFPRIRNQTNIYWGTCSVYRFIHFGLASVFYFIFILLVLRVRARCPLSVARAPTANWRCVSLRGDKQFHPANCDDQCDTSIQTVFWTHSRWLTAGFVRFVPKFISFHSWNARRLQFNDERQFICWWDDAVAAVAVAAARLRCFCC